MYLFSVTHRMTDDDMQCFTREQTRAQQVTMIAAIATAYGPAEWRQRARACVHWLTDDERQKVWDWALALANACCEAEHEVYGESE